VIKEFVGVIVPPTGLSPKAHEHAAKGTPFCDFPVFVQAIDQHWLIAWDNCPLKVPALCVVGSGAHSCPVGAALRQFSAS